MATSTRMRISYNALIYHRVDELSDAPEHDIATEQMVDGDLIPIPELGGIMDFEADSDSSVSFTTAHQVVTSSRLALSSSASCNMFIQFKNTGFEDAEKTIPITASPSNLAIHFADDVAHFFMVPHGGSIIIPQPAASLDQVSDYFLSCSFGEALYVEITVGYTS